MSTPLRSAALGIAAGFVAGLFGVGGGVIIVPGLVLWLALDQHRAHATSITAIVVAATVGAASFAVHDEVDWTAAGFIFLGAGVGAYAAARLTKRIPAIWLARGFVAVALISALRLTLQS